MRRRQTEKRDKVPYGVVSRESSEVFRPIVIPGETRDPLSFEPGVTAVWSRIKSGVPAIRAIAATLSSRYGSTQCSA